VGAISKRVQKNGDGVVEGAEDQSFAHHRKSLVALDAARGFDEWVDVG
jgi:hypothetical protein